MKRFFDFIGSCTTLCAHNADFDYGFLENNYKLNKEYTIIDTLELSRRILKNKRRHNLKALTKHFKIELENHHRAVDDSEATAKVLIEFFKILEEKNVTNINEINNFLADKSNIKKAKSFHVIILVKDYKGLKNLYKLVSVSHLRYFHKKPRIPKSLLSKYREGLIIGTACEAGELYSAILKGKNDKELDEIGSFYDFLEVQPTGNNAHLIDDGVVDDFKDLEDINKKIIELGEKLDKPVCATGDVHFLNPYDEVYRRILMYGQGFRDADKQAPLYFKSTDEVINDFNYLDIDRADEIVIKKQKN
jgi:DNA polymerase-3 subunit alpha (Gram-positive type)